MSHQARKTDALDYHSKGRPGKIEVVPTKPTKTQRDLSLAYSPGVAEPCIEISKNTADVYKYTGKSNLVAVISNGTAVLGLGNIGPEAAKPVMEGKGVLFKVFADIDVFDLEINETDPKKFVEIVKSLEPTFGGVNLEDIKSPECFEIEKLLKEQLHIPVMHDDQHGTAIISAAALLNALDIQKKKIDKVTFVVSGAGAASIACMNLYISMGAKIENMFLFDSIGMVHEKRDDLNYLKNPFAKGKKEQSLEKAMQGADVFVGLSKGDLLSKDMIKSMAKNPIVFALANPDPEINYDVARSVRNDIIMATGRSDFPNQVNNVLGFPYIFRGALDSRANCINEAMKIAAVEALAQLAKEPVPDIVNVAYGIKSLSYGKEYIIPKPLDPRLITSVAPAVAKAAIASGVAQIKEMDWEDYEQKLQSRLGQDNQISRAITVKARQAPQRVLYLDGENINILKAAQIAFDENIALPMLMGNKAKIEQMSLENNIDISKFPVIYPRLEEMTEKVQHFADQYYELRKRKGVNRFEAKMKIYDRAYFGAMMLANGECDAVLSNLSRNYSDTLKPAIEIIDCLNTANKCLAGMHILLSKRGPIFLADTTVHFNPTAQELADITYLVEEEVRSFGITPKIAMLSYSNFGSSNALEAVTVREARRLIKEKRPDLIVDGEMQGIVALNKQVLKENYSFSELLDQEVNTLIFPNLSAGNIAYNLLQELGGSESIGPIILGLKKPVHVLQISSSVQHIFNMSLIATIDAQSKVSSLPLHQEILAKQLAMYWKK